MEKKEFNAEYKKWHIIYGIVIVVLLLAMAGGGFYMHYSYKKATAESIAKYEKSTAEFDEAYARVIAEEENWQINLSELQTKLNDAYSELDDIYAARQKEIDDEEARWNALTKEQQDAELKCAEYNDMVSMLRETNEEYAQIYVEYAAYVGTDIFNLGKEEALAYTELYERKCEIEKEYMEAITE